MLKVGARPPGFAGETGFDGFAEWLAGERVRGG